MLVNDTTHNLSTVVTDTCRTKSTCACFFLNKAFGGYLNGKSSVSNFKHYCVKYKPTEATALCP